MPPDNPDPAGPAIPEDAPAVLLFGGTFDPPHQAHLKLALMARDQVLGPEAWLALVPAARSPHKESGPLASDQDRLQMLHLATEGAKNVEIWTDEIDRSSSELEPSYWVDTLARARDWLGSQMRIRFLIGADQVVAFHRWKDHHEILRLAEPVVMLRPPIDTVSALDRELASSGAWTEAEREKWSKRVVDLPVMDISATQMRDELASNHRVGAEKLHPKVEEYIRLHGLYGSSPLS